MQPEHLQEACELAAGYLHDVLWHTATKRQHEDLHRAIQAICQIAPLDPDFEINLGFVDPSNDPDAA